MIVLGMILLIESGTPKSHNKNRIMAMTGLVLLTVFFSFLLSVFRSKAQGYPYRWVNITANNQYNLFNFYSLLSPTVSCSNRIDCSPVPVQVHPYIVL